MYKLTTFKKIGEQFNLNDDIITKISDIHIKECNSYDNTLKYYENRYQLIYNNDYHNHRIKMDLVDSQFKNYIKRFLQSELILNIIDRFNNIRIYQINIFNIMYYDKILDFSINKNKFKNIIKFIKLNKRI